MENFSGVKIALVIQDQLVSIQRDNITNLPFAGLWDLPGGGREENETPIECIIREVKEELNIVITAEAIIWQKSFSSINQTNLPTYFMVAKLSPDILRKICLGKEGQQWKLMSINDFLNDINVINHLQKRLKTYLNESILDFNK